MLARSIPKAMAISPGYAGHVNIELLKPSRRSIGCHKMHRRAQPFGIGHLVASGKSLRRPMGASGTYLSVIPRMCRRSVTPPSHMQRLVNFPTNNASVHNACRERCLTSLRMLLHRDIRPGLTMPVSSWNLVQSECHPITPAPIYHKCA